MKKDANRYEVFYSRRNICNHKIIAHRWHANYRDTPFIMDRMRQSIKLHRVAGGSRRRILWRVKASLTVCLAPRLSPATNIIINMSCVPHDLCHQKFWFRLSYPIKTWSRCQFVFTIIALLRSRLFGGDGSVRQTRLKYAWMAFGASPFLIEFIRFITNVRSGLQICCFQNQSMWFDSKCSYLCLNRSRGIYVWVG